MSYTVAALYHFARLPSPAGLQPALLALCEENEVKGTLLLAAEGVNGTIAGPAAGIEAVIAHIKSWPGFADLAFKLSAATSAPFVRMKVRLKKEIVTLGQPGVDPTETVGTYVAPEDWNDLIAQDDVVLIDTRNDYEVGIGTFEGAVDPETKTFREFPGWWQENRARFGNKRVAMFCTGGIRCEKASSYLLGEGVEEVFHLKGGILKYLEEVPEADSRWNGSCFVFDERVSIGHGLSLGPHRLCRGCRRPIAPEDMQRPEFEEGVSCHQCHGETSDADKARFRDRQRQAERARARR